MSGTLTTVGYPQAAILPCAADLHLLTLPLVSQLCLCGSRKAWHTRVTNLGFHRALSMLEVSSSNDIVRGTPKPRMDCKHNLVALFGLGDENPEPYL